MHTLTTKVYDAAHTLKQTLEKLLLVDISAIREMVEKNEINITWIEKTKQIRESLQKLEHHPTSYQVYYLLQKSLNYELTK